MAIQQDVPKRIFQIQSKLNQLKALLIKLTKKTTQYQSFTGFLLSLNYASSIKEQCYVENNLCCPKIFIGMTHLFTKIEMTKVNNSTLLRVTIPCIRGSLMDLQNFFKLSLAKNFELSGGYFASS